MYMYIYYSSFLYVPFHALYCVAQFPLYCGNATQQVRNPCPGVAWHYTKWRRSRSAPPLGRAEMRLYLSWHLESRWKTQRWTETVGAGRLRWRCGAAWDSLWGWQGSARPISSWQLHRLENHQMSSAIHIWMAAVTVERLCVALARFSVCVCVCRIWFVSFIFFVNILIMCTTCVGFMMLVVRYSIYYKFKINAGFRYSFHHKMTKHWAFRIIHTIVQTGTFCPLFINHNYRYFIYSLCYPT